MMRNLLVLKNSLLMLVVVAAASAAEAQTFTVPAAVTSYETTVSTTLVQPQAIAADAAGDIFFSRPTLGVLAELPANGGAEITLYTAASGSGGYPKGVAANNKYAYMSDFAGHLWQVPIGGGAATDLAPACNSIDGYYLGTDEVATDGLGNVFVAGNNSAILFEINSAGVCSAVAGVTLDSTSHVAADAAGDLAYSASGNLLYSLPVGAKTAVAVSAVFSSIAGLRSDAAGNVFVTTGSTIVEVPFINGALSGANAFIVLTQTSGGDVAVDGNGSIYTASGTSLFKNTMGNVVFPATAVGTASAAETVNIVFNTATVLTAYRLAAGVGTTAEIINTGAGSCSHTGAYAPGASCTLTLTFKPSALGLRKDALELATATGIAGEVAVTGQGSGAGLAIDPGTQIALSAGWVAPASIAVDASGDAFVTDSSAGTVSYFTAGSTTATVIASGLTSPGAVAVGPDGNVYVISANSIVEIPYTGTAFGAASTVVTGLNAPSALQIGADGSLLIANTGAKTVVRIPNQSGTLNFASRATAVTLTAPDGLAVDASGTLYVSDSAAGTISKVASQVATTIVSGLTSPGALAVDAAGNLYVLQNGGAAVTRIAYTSGAYSTNATTALGSGFTKLASLAMDSAGNLYVVDAGGAAVAEIERTAGLLNLGKSNLSTPTSAQSLTLSNGGSASLTFGTPLYTASGATVDFTISTSATNMCVAGGSLASGANCAIAASFDPATTGSLTETLTISSNAANASAITGSFTGTGINLPKTTTTLTTVPNGTTTYGTSVTASVVVAPQTASTTAPTGTVTFFVNGVTYTTVMLQNGTASATIAGLPAGSDTIGASYSGDNNYGASSAQTASITVALAPTTTTLTSSITSASSVPPGTSVTLTAKVSSAVTSSGPTGTVSFMNGSTILATAALSNTGVATVTTTTLPTGTYTITAVYSGDSGFAGSTSNGAAVAVLPPSYVMSGTPASLTVSSPGSASAAFSIAPISGYIGGVDFACSGLPANAQCAFAPATVQFTGTNLAAQTVTLTVTAGTAPPTTVAWMLPLGTLLLAVAGRRRKLFAARTRLLMVLLLAVSCAAMSGLSGCSGSNGFQTPAGSSTVTVTATGTPNGTTTVPVSGAGNILQPFTFTLTVK